MQIRLKTNHDITGHSSEWNRNSLSEILVTYDDGDASSEFFKDYDVLIDDVWWPMDYCFINNLLISDNDNLRFRVPKNDEERERGYYF